MTSTYPCKICDSQTEKVFQQKVLLKYDVAYYKCKSCGFLQTEEPYWLEEAYKSPIADSDIGLIYRNLKLRQKTFNLIHYLFRKKQGNFLDYGGGYGMMVRMMRDLGMAFLNYDPYCENLLAPGFVLPSLKTKEKFQLITAFEVFEHLENPKDVLEQLFPLSDTILFSTEIQPETDSLQNWWYISPDMGQHVSIYTSDALGSLANQFNCKYYKLGSDLHLFTNKKVNSSWLRLITRGRFSEIIFSIYSLLSSNRSLLEDDYQNIRLQLLQRMQS